MKRLLVLLCLLPCLASPQAIARDNDVRSFVFKWFSLYDRNAPVQEYLKRLDNSGLLMQFPEATPIRSHDDYKKWYAGILKSVRQATHDIHTLDVSMTSPDHYDVNLTVTWKAIASGKPVELNVRQKWQIHRLAQDTFKITSYTVTPIAP